MSQGSFLGSILGTVSNSKKENTDERPIDKHRIHEREHDREHQLQHEKEDAERQKQWLDFQKESNSVLYNQLAKDSRNASYNPVYIKYCKPIAIFVLIISLILLVYVIITTIRNRSTKVFTAGVQQPMGQPLQLQHQTFQSPQPKPVGGGNKRNKSKFIKNMIKGGKQILKKMSGGNCGGECSCSAGFKY